MQWTMRGRCGEDGDQNGPLVQINLYIKTEDDPHTGEACAVREKVSKLLKRSGYCFGKKGQYGGEMWWHKCTANSLR